MYVCAKAGRAYIVVYRRECDGNLLTTVAVIFSSYMYVYFKGTKFDAPVGNKKKLIMSCC